MSFRHRAGQRVTIKCWMAQRHAGTIPLDAPAMASADAINPFEGAQTNLSCLASRPY
jgi:hypothetical protein